MNGLSKTSTSFATLNRSIPNNPHQDAALSGDAVKFFQDSLPNVLAPLIVIVIIAPQVVVRRASYGQINGATFQALHFL